MRKGRTVKVGEKGGLSVEKEEGIMVGKKGMVKMRKNGDGLRLEIRG